MKKHPVLVDDLGGHKKSTTKAQELVNSIVKRVRESENARNTWTHRVAHYYQRRYVREDRNVNWPWPNASDIVMPTIDMTIDRLKAAFSRIIFSKPIATFKVKNYQFQETARLNEVFFDWLLEEGMPDFKKEMIIGLDNILQNGFCVMKIFWDFKTRKATRLLRVDRLPPEMQNALPAIQAFDQRRRLARGANGTPEQRSAQNDQLTQLAQQALVLFTQALVSHYDFDPEDETDAKATAKIIKAFRQGEREVKYTTREVLANNPRAVCVDPNDLIVPSNTQNIHEASEITQRFYLTRSALKDRARDFGWSKKAVDLVLDRSKSSDARDNKATSNLRISATVPILRDKDFREGLNPTEKGDLIEFWEHYQWMDIDNDGHDEQVVTVIQPGMGNQAGGVLMKDVTELPFEHGEWPFVQMNFEANDRRFYSSRGIPEKIDDIDREITVRHRNKLNNMDMMVPSFTYRFGSEFNPDSSPFVPGAMIPVVNHDDFSPIPIPDRTVTDEREENLLLTWVSRYQGG